MIIMPGLRYLHIGVLVSLCLEAASPWQAWPVPPREIMADISNDLGICLLQVIGRDSRDNIAFSPYGVMSIVFLLYEGSHGNTAIEIYNSLRLPWDRHMSRIGFRDLHRHIKSYFSNDRFLRGLVLSKPSVPLKNEYVRLLNFYGFYPNQGASRPSIPPSIDTEGKERPEEEHRVPTIHTTPYIPKTEQTTEKSKIPTYNTPSIEITDEYQQTNYPDTFTSGYETDPTLPPYDPTKFPSKTTISEMNGRNNQRKPPKTTTYPVTFDDISTVKPGYNGHGMTQFFTPTDNPTEEDNIIPQNKSKQKSTTSGLYNPPKNGFTDPITESYTTIKQSTTTIRSTKPPTTTETEEENEVPVSLPEENETRTTGKDFPDFKPNEETTLPVSSTPSSEIEFPTEESETDSTGIDIRIGKIKSTTPSFDTAEATSPVPQTVLYEGRKNNFETETVSEQSKTESTQESTESTTSVTNLMGRIMTQKEVKNANQLVDKLGKTVVSETLPDMTTPTLATILMSLETTNQEVLTGNQATESSTIQMDESKIPRTTIEQTDKTVTEASTILTQSTEAIPQATTSQTSLNETSQTEKRRKKRSSDVRRSLIGLPPPYDQRDGSNNWIPPGEGPHWEYNVPRDQWFFTYSGSEPVPVITYMDYLPFTFIESINTLALQLPLDDPRYAMLVLLPMERYGLENLLDSLHQCSIRQILQDLKVIPVYAVLPAFTLVKHVNLVPALAKMGIEEVFDPSRSDLSGMADEPHLYVRSIEQLVTVSLRKYHYTTRRFDGRPEEIRHHFIANHPFVYFVLDTETNAALMAGTIVNPTYKQQANKK